MSDNKLSVTLDGNSLLETSQQGTLILTHNDDGVSVDWNEGGEPWDRYIGATGLCGLCGNTGIIDTIGEVFSQAGVECGIRGPCICPNGSKVAVWQPAEPIQSAVVMRGAEGEQPQQREITSVLDDGTIVWGA